MRLYWKPQRNVILPDSSGLDFVGDFPFWCAQVKRFTDRHIVDAFIIDDADLLFKTHFDVNPQLQDLVINNRHYGLTLIFVSRRPQDIPTRIYGICEILCLFAIDSPHVIKLLNDYSDGLGDRVRELDPRSHDFIYKHSGLPPVRAHV